MRLGELTKCISKKNKDGHCTTVCSVTNSQGFVLSTEYFSKEVFSKELRSYKLVERNQLAYNPSRINVGSIALQDIDDEVVVSPLYVVFSVDANRIDPAYLLRYLKSSPGLNQVEFQSIGTVRNNLKYDGLCRIPIFLPPLEAQRSRVRSLIALETEIKDAEGLLPKLDALVKSRFVEMFGDPTAPGDRWPVSRLDGFTKIITGNTPPRKHAEYYGDGIEWVKTDNIVDSTITTASERLTEIGRSKARVAPTGSILMACIAGSVKSIGKVGLLDREVAFNQQINAIVPMDIADSRYLLTMFTVSKNYLCSDVNQQLKGILNKSSLSSKQFPLPPLALQQEFASFAAEVDKSRFVARRIRETLGEYNEMTMEHVTCVKGDSL